MNEEELRKIATLAEAEAKRVKYETTKLAWLELHLSILKLLLQIKREAMYNEYEETRNGIKR